VRRLGKRGREKGVGDKLLLARHHHGDDGQEVAPPVSSGPSCVSVFSREVWHGEKSGVRGRRVQSGEARGWGRSAGFYSRGVLMVDMVHKVGSRERERLGGMGGVIMQGGREASTVRLTRGRVACPIGHGEATFKTGRRCSIRTDGRREHAGGSGSLRWGLCTVPCRPTT
jgi:hypothetical protein